MTRWLVRSLLLAGLCSAALPTHAQTAATADGGRAALNAAPVQPQAIPGEAARRQALVAEITSRWGAFVAETYETDAASWENNLSALLTRASVETLQRASRAKTFTAMNNLLLGSDAVSAPVAGRLTGGDAAVASRIGDAAIDLVFVPVTPCRIIDTRVAGGVMAANSVRSFDITGVTNYAFQGGDASSCNGVGTAGSFAAAAINFTVVTPSAGGYITAFPFLGTQPLAATLVYGAGDILSNSAVVKLDQGASTNELSVYTFAQTHLVADIVGYYSEPAATADCTATSITTFTIAANTATYFQNAACPSGYQPITPYCYSGFPGVQSQGSGFVNNIVGDPTFCAWHNTTGVASITFGGNVCCRIH